MLQLLYQLIIYPIELLLEAAFSIAYEFRHDVGLSIICVSLLVNFLLLPLYNRADQISEIERSRQKSMEPNVRHIRQTFHGDERFMMLQTYYRKCSYHPIYALSSSLSLLLQVPFFIAAYHFLSNLSRLNQMSFLWIRDLGQPDGIVWIPAIGLNIYPAMVALPGFTVNVLPVLMTLINIISTVIYTKDASFKEKLQLYIMAAIFLVLLYNSPSGLVVYWIMNNLFSLVKNLILKFRGNSYREKGIEKIKRRETDKLFFLGAIFLMATMGLLIPSSVIVSSPQEFVIVAAYKNPLQYVLSTMITSAGLFLIWIPLFYYLAPVKSKGLLSALVWLCCGIALVDYLLFGKSGSYVSPELKYDVEPVFSRGIIAINIVTLIVILVVMVWVFIKWNKNVKIVYYLLISAVVILSGINIIQTQRQIEDVSYLRNGVKPYEGFTLSRKGKNVVVIMLDRGIGTYMPFIISERPDLKEKYSGFINYTNVVSHGGNTVAGAPGLFGGYEYTPESMNKRPDETLKDKHDEALKVMPVLFSANGFRTTVYDPPLAGYQEISDLSIYENYPNVKAYSLKERFVDPDAISYIENYRRRCFFMYSICKSMPLLLQPGVYDDGKYLYPDDRAYFSTGFLGNYGVLQNLSRLTRIEDSDQNTFMMMDNETPHEYSELQLPDYTLVPNVNNLGLETGYRTDEKNNTIEIDDAQQYYVNIVAILEIAKWLDYLKEMDVYDNTRIIIVSDHGYGLGEFNDLILDDGSDMQLFIPILMYKDFNATSFIQSTDFMTNADTPSLAMRGIIEKPTNPFTGEVIDDHEKNQHDQLLTFANGLREDKNRKVFDKPDEVWYSIKDNIYDKSNWTILSSSDVP